MAKKLPKAPKRPKRSSSLATWERYDQKVNAWKQKVNAFHAAKRKKESLINKYAGGNSPLTRLRVA